MPRCNLMAGAAVVFLVTPSFAAGTDVDVTVRSEIAYGELGHSQTLDIYMPETTTAGTPVLVFFYGGGWMSGDKSGLALIGRSFAKAGVIFVAPNYRHAPSTMFPKFVEDSALAVSFVWQELRSADGSPHPVFVGGFSSGAYNAAMVSIDQRYLAANGVPAGAVTGFIGLAGPYEGGMCGGVRCKYVFPDDEQAQWAVADFIDKDDPPMLLIAAKEDQQVPIRNLEGLAAAAEHAGVDVTTLVVPGGNHASVMAGLMDSKGSIRSIRSGVGAFIADTLER